MIGVSIVAIKGIRLRQSNSAVGNEQIKEAIVVNVTPRASIRGGNVRHHVTLRDFGESAVAVIAVEAVVRSVVRNEQIQVSIVVIVCPRATGENPGIIDDVAGE